MANTLNVGNGDWATKENSLLGYNSENGNYKPLPFDFTRASNGTFVNKSGLIETAASGVPRIDFLGNTKGAMLLEPQRTNLVTYSEDFIQWTDAGTTTVLSNITNPSGGLQSYLLSASSSATNALRYDNSFSVSANYSYSLFLKAGTSQEVRMQIYDGSSFFRFAVNPLNNFAVVDQSGVNSYLIEDYTNGWKRVSINITTSASASTGYLQIYPDRTGNLNNVYIWGAQAEVGSYSTSLINTQGSAVTRVQDACNQTVPDGVIGQTEGVIFLDIKMPSVIQSNTTFSIGGGTSGEYAQLEIRSDLSINWRYRVGNGDYINANVGSYLGGDRLKLAFAYKNGDSILYKNGVSIATDTGSIVSNSWNNVDFSNYAGTGKLNADVNQTSLYNTRLSNSELAALTTI